MALRNLPALNNEAALASPCGALVPLFSQSAYPDLRYACTKKYAVMPAPTAITNHLTQSFGSRSE